VCSRLAQLRRTHPPPERPHMHCPELGATAGMSPDRALPLHVQPSTFGRQLSTSERYNFFVPISAFIMSRETIALESPRSTHLRSPSPASFRRPTPEIHLSRLGQPASSSFSTSWPVAGSFQHHAAYFSASSSPAARSRSPSVAGRSAEAQDAKVNQTSSTTGYPASPRPHLTERSHHTSATLAVASGTVLSTSVNALGVGGSSTLKPRPGVLTPPASLNPSPSVPVLSNIHQPYTPHPALHGPVMSNMHHPGAPLTMPPLSGMGFGGLMPPIPTLSHAHGMALYAPHGHMVPQKQTDRPFKCDSCPQSFNRNHDLKRHKRIHLAIKPFPCGYCEKSFSRKDALQVRPLPNSFHIANTHTRGTASLKVAANQ
jgi:uncharacterized Zn-finger protein